VAEFVGDSETMDELRAMGVDYAQGYHLGRPTPAGELTAPAIGRPRTAPGRPGR
jgi:EAL domain-containing protein (putative c-di-GMP-specific phosphodiesterase class I)